MYYRHIWNKDEVERCYKEAYENQPNENRFGGILLPFLGGLLIGGLFVPRPNQYNQLPPAQYQYQYQYPPYPYYPQPQQVPYQYYEQK